LRNIQWHEGSRGLSVIAELLVNITSMVILAVFRYYSVTINAQTLVWVNSTSDLSTGRRGPCSPVFEKIARLVGQLGTRPRLVGRIRSGVRVSASLKKMPASWVC